MTNAPKPPLRGEAAYRAEKLAIAKSNEAASAAAQRKRAAKDAASVNETEKRAQREMKTLRGRP
jgi:hypothetical protein